MPDRGPEGAGRVTENRTGPGDEHWTSIPVVEASNVVLNVVSAGDEG